MTTPATPAATVTPVTPVTPVAPLPGTPEYDAAMAEKFEKSKVVDGAPPVKDEAPAAPVRPENLPEKFWDPTAADPIAAGYAKLAASYTELEKARSKPADQQTPAPKVDEKTGLEIKPATPGVDDGAKSAIEAAGLNLETLSEEFRTTGALKDESYTAFEKIGLPKQYIDNYILGQQALAAQFEAKAFEVAGGEAQYKQMTSWAAANLKPAELTAFNGAVNGTAEQMAMAVGSLRGRYEAANGSAPKLLAGGPTGATEGFASQAEQTAAINLKDAEGRKLYDRDPAYRAKVAARIAVSTF